MPQEGFEGTIETPHGPLNLADRTLVMGILNVTPDSFSDGGRFDDTDAAVARAQRMLAEGADILDIGAESTRPGAAEVDPDVQLRRILPVLQRVRAAHPGAILSIDTRSAAVAERTVGAGADIINDVSALRHDAAMVPTVARLGVPVILMHMKGTPATMLQEAEYRDVVKEVIDFFSARAGEVELAGIGRERIIIDPGIGFAKNIFHNLDVLRRIDEFHELGLPLLVGPSRKRFLGHVLGLEQTDDRLYGTLATVAVCARARVQIVRVHDVRPARHVVEVIEAIRHPEQFM